MRTILLISAVFCLLVETVSGASDREVQGLIERLSSPNKKARLEAVDTLAALGQDASAAVPALTALLKGRDGELAWRACRTLGAIGESGSAAVPQLIESLGDGNAKVRAYAAFALGRMDKAAMPAVDELIKNAFDAEELVRRASIRAIQRIDPPQEKTLPLVVRILEAEDQSVIMPALQTMAQEGVAHLPRLRTALKHERARYWACLVLAEIGPAAAPAIPELLELLEADDADVRLQALLTLGEIGEAAKAATPQVLALFEHDDFGDVRHAAGYALGKLGASGPAAIEALQRASASRDEFLRTISAWALAKAQPEDKDTVARAVRRLVQAFDSEDASVRQFAARALVEFDVDRELVAPALVAALQDKDKTVVANAIDALAAQGAKSLRYIEAALQNNELRHYALLLISRLGPDAAAAVPALVRVLPAKPAGPEDAEFVREAQFALARIGPAAAPAVPRLIQSLSSEDEQIRVTASFALGKIGSAARAAVPALRAALSSESQIVKVASIRALLEIQPGQRQLAVIAAPLLVRALDHEREFVRAEAAAALGELGELGKQAIPKLKQLLEDDHEFVREAAAQALKSLGG